MNEFLATAAAGLFGFFPALVALDKEQVTGIVYTVDMGITGLAALVAMGDHIF